MRERYFLLQPLHYNAVSRKYEQQNCDIYLRESEIKEIVLTHESEVGTIKTSDTGFPILISMDRALDIAEILCSETEEEKQ